MSRRGWARRRQIGLNVRQEVIETRSFALGSERIAAASRAKFDNDLRSGNYQVAIDFACGYSVEPDLDLYKFLSRDVSPANLGRYTDRVLDDLYQKQSRTVDPEERKKWLRAFEKRLLDEEAHYLYTLQWHRTVPHNAKVRGWTITPSHYLNQQLNTVWLAE